MKAVISNRIILNVDKELKDKIVTELTYRIEQKFNRTTAGPEIIRTYSRIKDNIFSVPSGRMDLIPPDYEIIDKRTLVPVEFPKFKFTLRESQQYVHDSVVDSALINAPVSWGKTFTGIAIAAKLGQKTLVLTHTTMLRDQWIMDIDNCLGIKAGIIGSGKWDLDSQIVVANVQTATKRVADLATLFGTIIVDECHHIPATTFNNILDKCTARYKIGLSGTLERKDKKHVIFNDFFGYNVFKPEAENCMVPEIVIYKTDQVIPGGVHWSNRITELENHTPDYRKLVTELADSAANMGHKVLIVASRVDLLEWCAENSVHPAVVISGRVAELAERRLKLDAIANGEADLLYGTCSIFAEGISENSLSCLILATPINNDPMLTQLIGRIVRLKEGKLQPLVIDINLKGSQAVSQARNRYSHYLRKGYKIRVIDKSS